jgi:uncharacterized phage protein (TIGR01671 family)
MRIDIEFRAKQGKIIQHFPIRYGLTDWIYGLVHCSFGGSFFTYISNINDEKMETETYAVESNTVCQFTGLKDKNGKKIFENDIVKCGYGIGKVIFHCGSFMVEWISDKEANMELLNSRKGIYTRSDDELFEIIGNTFDNPELLSV